MSPATTTTTTTRKKKKIYERRMYKIHKAVNSLLKWKQTHLYSYLNTTTDDHIYLSLTLKNRPGKKYTKTPYKIPLKHPLNISCKTCLIIDDRPKRVSKTLTFEYASKKIKALGIPISQIVKFSKIKADYRSVEAKTKFFKAFDVFLADERLTELLPEVLGNVFYKKRKKIPVPLDLGFDKNWKQEIEKGFRCGMLWLSKGTRRSVVKVGKFGVMSENEIVDNVVSAVSEVMEVVLRKQKGLHESIDVKFCNSFSLTIVQGKNKIIFR